MATPHEPYLPAWDALQQRLGWTFRDVRLMRAALTHSTYANEYPGVLCSYERMEFLGDAILDAIAARLLYDMFPHASEGELSQRRAQVVRRESLAQMASAMGLEACLLVGQGQRGMAGLGRRILADAYESMIGAVFLDAGYDVAVRCFASDVQKAIEQTRDTFDYKTQLQELCHAHGKGQPVYRVLSVDGPDHAKHFSCDVSINDNVMGVGQAANKKMAEQDCAKMAIQAILENRIGT